MNQFRSGAIAMLAEKLVRMATQLGSVVLLARFLGADGFGILMYCYAIASVFLFLNNFGLSSLLVKWIAEDSSNTRAYLSKAACIRCAAALLCVVLTNLSGLWLLDEANRTLLLVISLYHLLMPVSVIEWYFQAVGRATLSAYGLIAGSVVGFLVRLVALVLGADIVWLGAAYTIELLVVAIVYFLIWKYKAISLKQSASDIQVRNMVREALPLLISGAVIMLYMRIDQLMLGYMRGPSEVGVYTAAVRLSEAWYFIGITLLGVYFPKFIELRASLGVTSYMKSVSKIGRIMFWGGVFLAVVTTALSEIIVSIFYGGTLDAASTVLCITIWAVPFVNLGGIMAKNYMLHNEAKPLVYRSVFALFVNVACNYMLIPLYGAVGAAVGLLLSQLCIGLLFSLIVFRKDDVDIVSYIIFWRGVK